jgi:hypothetical protein
VALIAGLLAGWPSKRTAVSTNVAFVWPSSRQPLLGFLRRASRGVFKGAVGGVIVGLVLGLVVGLLVRLVGPQGLVVGLVAGLFVGLLGGLVVGLIVGLGLGLVAGLVDPRSMLIASSTPKEASPRSLTAALIWLVVGLGLGLSTTLFVASLLEGMLIGLGLGLGLGLRNGGGFVLLQKVAHRRLAQAGNLPPRPADFLEWGIEQQIFRRVGGGVRFRHGLIQQHLANSSVDKQETSTVGAGA